MHRQCSCSASSLGNESWHWLKMRAQWKIAPGQHAMTVAAPWLVDYTKMNIFIAMHKP